MSGKNQPTGQQLIVNYKVLSDMIVKYSTTHPDLARLLTFSTLSSNPEHILDVYECCSFIYTQRFAEEALAKATSVANTKKSQVK